MINIERAQKSISAIVELATLNGSINAAGKYLLFDHIKINEAAIDDWDYVFKAYVAINTRTDDKQLIYKPLEQVLTPLLADQTNGGKVSVGTIKPYAVQGLIVYQIDLTVAGFEPTY